MSFPKEVAEAIGEAVAKQNPHKSHDFHGAKEWYKRNVQVCSKCGSQYTQATISNMYMPFGSHFDGPKHHLPCGEKQ